MRSHARHAASIATLAALLLACAGERHPGDRTLFVALDTLPSPAGPGSAEPNLAVGTDGHLYLTWLEAAAESSHVMKLAMHDGTAWSSPSTVARGRSFFVNWADFPSVATLPDGRLAAHWLERSGTGRYAYDVRIAQSVDGGRTWSSPVTPHHDSSAAEHGFVSLFSAAQAVGAVWLDGRKYGDGEGPGKEMMLLQGGVTAAGSSAAEVSLDARTCDCCQTAVAMTARGPIVVYRDRSADEVRDIAIVRLIDGAWTPPAIVHADGWRIAACPVNGPAVAANGERVAVAWFTAASDTARVQLAFSSDAGVTFSAPVRVDLGNPAGRVGVLLRPDGSAIVSWMERGGAEEARVLARRVSPDGSVGDPAAVAASTSARASGFPRMVANGDTVTFAWTVPGSPSVVRVAQGRLRAGS